MVGKRNRDIKVVNPLLIISLFLSLTELAMLVAATQVAGLLQWVFGIFSVAFGSLVAAVFFFLLWKRNQILYSPKDFADRNAIDFVRAMHVSRESTARYLSNVEREQEIAARKAETELELLRQQLGDKDRVLRVEMLRVFAQSGAMDGSSAEMQNLARNLLRTLMNEDGSSEYKQKPRIEAGRDEDLDKGDPDSSDDK
jgi:DNA-binding transcriptional MerR regulator